MFYKLFFRFSPIYKFKIFGNSMSPTLSANDIVLVNRLEYIFKKPKEGDIIACNDPRDERILIKRIIKIENNAYFVQGDNKYASTDSRVFGKIRHKDIIGKIIPL